MSRSLRAGFDWNCAVTFLTIVPTPATKTIEPDWIPRSIRYFPLVDMLVGAFSAAVLLLASQIRPGALLAAAASAVITGAFHEDGLADTADGLGGGYSRDARLVIMQDSRVGTYGALALDFSIAFRAATLAALPVLAGAAALLAAHAGGRIAAMVVMAMLPYAKDPAAGKVAHSSEPPGAPNSGRPSSSRWSPPRRLR
jgi:adenosylcobinamide-GDP ribazoletransferase